MWSYALFYFSLVKRSTIFLQGIFFLFFSYININYFCRILVQPTKKQKKTKKNSSLNHYISMFSLQWFFFNSFFCIYLWISHCKNRFWVDYFKCKCFLNFTFFIGTFVSSMCQMCSNQKKIQPFNDLFQYTTIFII